MHRSVLHRSALLFGLLSVVGCADDKRSNSPSTPTPAIPITALDWPQWGQSALHRGELGVVAQSLTRIHAELLLDGLVEQQKRETNDHLLTHYPVPLVVGGEQVLLAFQSGSFVNCNPPGSGQPAPCGSATWDRQQWSVRMLRWEGDALTTQWSFGSDWKPVPDAGGLNGWEPVFHPVLAGDFAFVPGAGGTVHRVQRADGRQAERINPFAGVDGDRFVTGPLTADPQGNVLYHVIQLDLGNPWGRDVRGAWLVRIGTDGSAQAVALGSLVSGAPGGGDACEGSFDGNAPLPWPPSSGAVPPTIACGSQRAGVNVAPAVGPDGTIYTVTRAHLSSRHAYLVAINGNLTPRWASSLRDRLDDGCGSPQLPDGQPGSCRPGANRGVDPATNSRPAGRVVDSSSSTPTVAPDGAVLYGAYTRYNGSRGHLMKFAGDGQFLGSHDFGWDTTPAIFQHDGTYSVIIKENEYGAGSYCGDPTHCPRRPEGPYDITQLNADLQRVEWRFTNTETQACRRNGDGMVCEGGHPNGFEWCVNAPVVAADGTVYANAEDGYLYSIAQGGGMRQRVFLDSALGAAYTPLSLDRNGRIYTQNNGWLFVVGN